MLAIQKRKNRTIITNNENGVVKEAKEQIVKTQESWKEYAQKEKADTHKYQSFKNNK